MPTEQQLRASSELDTLSTRGVMELMNAQDAEVAGVVAEAIPQVADLADVVIDALGREGRLIYIGAGTSGRLGVLDAAECPPTFHSDPTQVIGLIAGDEPALRQAVEGAEDDTDAARQAVAAVNPEARDVVLGIAAGGTTSYVWAGLAEARRRQATTGLMTCVPLDQANDCRAEHPRPDHVIELPVGPELVTGSTRLKAGTATKLALNMLTTATFVRMGKVWGNLMVDLRVSNAKLRERALTILNQQADLDREAASDLLERAGQHVKVALVMARLNVDLTEAKQRLSEHGGHLRLLLGPPRDLSIARR